MEKDTATAKLSISAWNVIMNALANRPYAEVYEVITSLREQISNQITAKNNTENIQE